MTPVVIVTTKMNRVVEVDADARVAWVEPGVLNLDLTRQVAHSGCTSRPTRRASRAARSGATSPTTPAVRIASHTASRHARRSPSRSCCPTARSTMLGGLDPEPVGLDLRGAFVGGEGTSGIATKIAVRLTPNPPAIRTLLARLRLDGRRGRDGERDHRRRHRARRDRDDGRPVHAGRRGLRARRIPSRRRGGSASSSSTVSPTGSRPRAARVCDDRDRRRRTDGRGSPRTTPNGHCGGRDARPRSARSPASSPNYYLHDTVVPRTQARRGAPRRCTRSPRATSSIVHERLPRRRREPPPAARVRRA